MSDHPEQSEIPLPLKNESKQNEPLHPQALPLRNLITFLVGIAAIMFYFAIDIWLNKIDPCQRSSSSFRCHLANFWAQLTDIPRYFADAQYWVALGLMRLLISYLGWRNRSHASDAKAPVKRDKPAGITNEA